MVGHYINTHQVNEEESEVISRAIQAKSDAERSRNSKSCDNTSPSSSDVITSSVNVVADKCSNAQENQRFTHKRHDEKKVIVNNIKNNESRESTSTSTCQPEHL